MSPKAMHREIAVMSVTRSRSTSGRASASCRSNEPLPKGAALSSPLAPSPLAVVDGRLTETQ